MAYFTNRKLARLSATVAVRADYIEQAQRATNENIYTLERIIHQALPLAYRQVEEFEDYTGEAMPCHLHEAITTEIQFWEYLQASLADYKEAEPNDHDAVTYAKNVRQFLRVQLDLVHLTEELINSCLVDHYRAALDDLRAQATKVPL